eukprot:9670344-Karenia_brevis.AAC.1
MLAIKGEASLTLWVQVNNIYDHGESIIESIMAGGCPNKGTDLPYHRSLRGLPWWCALLCAHSV